MDKTWLALEHLTGTVSRRADLPEMLLGFRINGAGLDEVVPEEWIQGGERRRHEVVTLMWTFPNVPAGDYWVSATGRMGGPYEDGPDAVVHTCSLTVLVVPVEA